MKTSKKIMAALIVTSLMLGVSAFGAQTRIGQADSENGTAVQNPVGDNREESIRHGKRHNGPIEMLGRFQFENMAAQTISVLSSQPIEAVTAKLKESRLPKVLKEYNITKEAFQAAMKPKFVALVQKRVDDGSITAAQQALILEALEKQGSRHAIMEKLIRNGVTAGIITQDEADKMLSRRDEKPPAE